MTLYAVNDNGDPVGSVDVQDANAFEVDWTLQKRAVRRRMGKPLSAEDVLARGVKPLTDEELASLFGGV